MFKTILVPLSFLLFVTSSIYAQNALHFDGTNDIVNTTYSGISGNTSRSVEAWIKTPFVTGQEVITDWGTASTGGRFTFALIDGKVRVEVHGSGVTSTTVVGDNTWHHVAVTFNNSSSPKYRVYVDGVLENSFNITTTINTGTTVNLRLGQRIDGANEFIGSMDEVRVWNTQRTAAEIQSNMNSEFCVIPASLKAYYKFNQGTASGSNTGLTTLNDNSGNVYNGILSGFSLAGSTSNWVTGVALTTGGLVGGIDTNSNCIPYTTIGNQVLTTSGIYPDTFTMSSGCDSIYTIDFTAIQPSFGTITTTECDTFLAPSGIILSSSGIFLDTIPNFTGCDSIITINLTINNSTASSITTSNCNSYTSPGGIVYTSTGIYYETYPNSSGCDSTVTLDVTIINGYYITLNEIGCDDYTSPSGKVWTATGTYLDTVVTGTGCDSLFTINLVINQTSTNTITASACDEYISDIGNTYTTTGTYIETLVNASGCDSVITLNLTITHVITAVTISGNTITASAVGVTYRWLDCNDNYAPISGGNQQSYTTDEDGDYAVKITDGTCTDTSFCVNVTGVGINDLSQSQFITFFPNPASKVLSITNSKELIEVSIVSITGELIKTIAIPTGTVQFDISYLGTGMYLIKYEADNNQFMQKLIIK